MTPTAPVELESPIRPARGTRDWLPDDFEALAQLEAALLERFGRAGYRALRTPILEPAELHERKSGAGIVSRLYGVVNGHAGALCLRPELTAGIVRAYAEAPEPPVLPWRVAAAGPGFRHEQDPDPRLAREFTQVGVERIGDSGPAADAELIWLADWACRETTRIEPTIRIGHVGLILEVLERSGLPPVARAALVEVLSEAASRGQDVRALGASLEQLAGWLRSGGGAEEVLPAVPADDRGVDRLFRQLVPDVTGRRSGHEIIGRLRRKWDLSHSLQAVLDRVRDHINELADLRGPAPTILERLEIWYSSLAPESVAGIRSLIDLLGHHGVPADRIELDLGFGRGIGFYSRMIFELAAEANGQPVVVCGGGRYDGLARVLGSDRDDRGAGFAFGLERLLAAGPPAPHRGLVGTDLVVPSSPALLAEAIGLANRLRSQGGTVELESSRTPDEAAALAQVRGIGRVIVVTDRTGLVRVVDRIGDRTTLEAADSVLPRTRPSR